MADKELNSLRAGFSPLPLMGFSDGMYRFGSWYNYNTCTITLGERMLSFDYTTQPLPLPINLHKQRTLPYSEIDSYFRPYPTLIFLKHHSKHIPRYITIGQALYDDIRKADADALVIELAAHQIPEFKQSAKEKKRFALLLAIFGAVFVIGITVYIWVSLKTT